MDLSVVALATWTVVYHVCLVLGLGARWAVGLAIVALAAVGAMWFRTRATSLTERGPATHDADTGRGHRTAITDGTVTGRVLLAVAVAAGVGAASLTAVGGDWPLTAGLWLAAAAAGTAVAAMRLWKARPWRAWVAGGARRSDSGGAAVAVLWAGALAALSLFVRRANDDDLYYVNLAQWVADRGTFALRDTIFSDLAHPMSSWPPVASDDALAGTVALLAGVPAASVVYLVVPPLATFLSVLALWRLLREWRVEIVGVALSLALVFLLFDSGPGYMAPGRLFVTRMWQGKVILLGLLVPTLLVYALRYVERPTAARAAWMSAAGVAAVGLTTSAMFLVPLIAVAGMAPLALRQPGRAVTGFLAAAAYPLAAGAVTLLVGGRSADLFATRKLFRFDPGWFGPNILQDGVVAFVAVAAVLAGALLIPHLAARVTIGLLAVIVGVTFVPGVTELSFDLIGLGPTLWRVSWIVPIAALVGVLGVALGSVGGSRIVQAAVPIAVALLLVLTSQPIWSLEEITVDDRPQWKRKPTDMTTTEQVLDVARPGDLVLAPRSLAVTLTVTTTQVKTVAPRAYFMDYLRDDPTFHYDERQTLLDFIVRDVLPAEAPEVARALDVLDVDLVCVPSGAPERGPFLAAEGYEAVVETDAHSCMAR